jgi:hypothetical protein
MSLISPWSEPTFSQRQQKSQQQHQNVPGVLRQQKEDEKHAIYTGSNARFTGIKPEDFIAPSWDAMGGATANTRKFLLLLIKAIAAASDEPFSVIANRIHSRMSVLIVKSIAINALTSRGRLLPATGSRGSQQQSQSQPEGWVAAPAWHGGVAVSARTSSVTAGAAVTAVAGAVTAVAVTAERVAGRDKAVRTQQMPTQQQLDSEGQ